MCAYNSQFILIYYPFLNYRKLMAYSTGFSFKKPYFALIKNFYKKNHIKYSQKKGASKFLNSLQNICKKRRKKTLSLQINLL